MDKYKFCISKNKYGYYIKLIDSINILEIYSSDLAISKLLGLSIEEYQRIFLDKFRCKKLQGEIYFNSKDSILKAVDWIKGNLDLFLVAKTLIE